MGFDKNINIFMKMLKFQNNSKHCSRIYLLELFMQFNIFIINNNDAKDIISFVIFFTTEYIMSVYHSIFCAKMFNAV